MTDLQPEELISVMELENEEIDDLGTGGPLSDEPVVSDEEQKPDEEVDEEKKAEAERDTGEESEEPDGDDEDEEPAKKKRPGKAARKITRLEAELQANRERIARLEGQQAVAPAPKEDPEPREDDFEHQIDFVAAKAEHRALKRLRVEQAESQKKETERTQATRQAELQAAHTRRIEEARDNHEDYDEVVNAASHLQVTDTMGQAIMESEQGADVVYYLAQHPEDVRRIAGLSAIAQARELGKIEARLEPAEVPRKKVTSAPNPPSKVRPSGSAPKSLENMDHEAYRKARLGA